MRDEALNLSIVIPAFNEAVRMRDRAGLLNKAVAEGDIDPLVTELIVVDDGSTDETARLAERLLAPVYPRLRILQMSKNSGQGCCNTGWSGGRRGALRRLHGRRHVGRSGAGPAAGGRHAGCARRDRVESDGRLERAVLSSPPRDHGTHVQLLGQRRDKRRSQGHPMWLQGIPYPRGADSVPSDGDRSIRLRRRRVDTGPSARHGDLRGPGRVGGIREQHRAADVGFDGNGDRRAPHSVAEEKASNSGPDGQRRRTRSKKRPEPDNR